METRGWDDGRQATYRMRAKETSDDYRYFPDPDLPPLHVERGVDRRDPGELPELPAARRARYEALGLSGYDAAVLVADPAMTPRSTRSRAAGPDAAGEGGRELRDGRRTRASRRRRATTQRAPPARRTPADIADAPGRDRRRRRLAPGRPGAARAPPRRRHAGRRRSSPAPAPGRSRTTRRCSATSTRSSPRTPRPWRDYRAGKPVAGLLRGAGDEGDGRRRGRRPGDPAGPRSAWTRRLTWDC